jgi:hypothetical protein
MASAPLAKITAKTAADICKNFKLEEPAKKLLRDDMSPRQFFDVLMEQQQYLDAVRLLAYGLPKQEAVWWACQCARSIAGATPPPKIAAALDAAEKWVADPSEDNRRAAQTAAEAAEMGTPAGCAAIAAFWSGGSLGPPNVPVVPPGEYLTAHGVAGSVMLAAVQTEPVKAPEKYRKFFDLGVAIATGSNRWKEAAKK